MTTMRACYKCKLKLWSFIKIPGFVSTLSWLVVQGYISYQFFPCIYTKFKTIFLKDGNKSWENLKVHWLLNFAFKTHQIMFAGTSNFKFYHNHFSENYFHGLWRRSWLLNVRFIFTNIKAGNEFALRDHKFSC